MNSHQAGTHLPLSHERHQEADTRLHGRWLLIRTHPASPFSIVCFPLLLPV